jgi:hypothetical protein
VSAEVDAAVLVVGVRGAVVPFQEEGGARVQPGPDVQGEVVQDRRVRGVPGAGEADHDALRGARQGVHQEPDLHKEAPVERDQELVAPAPGDVLRLVGGGQGQLQDAVRLVRFDLRGGRAARAVVVDRPLELRVGLRRERHKVVELVAPGGAGVDHFLQHVPHPGDDLVRAERGVEGGPSSAAALGLCVNGGHYGFLSVEGKEWQEKGAPQPGSRQGAPVEPGVS